MKDFSFFNYHNYYKRIYLKKNNFLKKIKSQNLNFYLL